MGQTHNPQGFAALRVEGRHMADMDYYGADYGVERPSRFADAARNFGFANWAGAITSLGLTAGLAVWAVDLTFRDVSGVPVIAALEGPMRVAPENPGGKVAPFQGLALADITSGGAAAPAPDQVVLAPPPVSLDAPALAARAAATPNDAAPATPIQTAELDREELSGSIEMALFEAIEDESFVGASAPTDQVIAPEPVSAAPGTPTEVARADVTEAAPGITRSIRPRARPANRAVSLAQGPASVPTEAPVQAAGTQVASLEATVPSSRDVDPSTLTPGTRVVQLGAYDSEAAARGEWDRFNARFSDYMVGKGRLIQKATSGGRDFWRLRVVGFDDSSEARRFCAELLAQDAACIPVTVR